MGSERSGLHGLLELAPVYSAFQRMISRSDAAETIRRELYPELGTRPIRVLDIGCGPAAFWARYRSIGNIRYVGVEPNERYVEDARGRFPEIELHAGTVADLAGAVSGPFDLVVLEGVLHHIDDIMAREALRFSAEHLRRGGRVVALDPVIIERQNPIARLLARMDRGRHVRSLEGYRSLAVGLFADESVSVRRLTGQLRVPYDHSVLEATVTP